MDVTRDSFEQSLEALDASIADPNFAFWSFDLEFTGLNVDRTSKFDVFDTLAERWKKVHTNVSKFTVLQYGICLFSFCPDTRRWQSKPFNFGCSRIRPGIHLKCFRAKLRAWLFYHPATSTSTSAWSRGCRSCHRQR